MKRATHLLLLVGSLLAGRAAYASDDPEVATTYAIQPRDYHLTHEFNFGIGVLPMNAFNAGITIGGGYTWHISPLWAWEIAQFQYVFNIDSGLKSSLLNNFQVQPTVVPSLDYFASSNLVFKPFYGKLAIVNRRVIHMEIFLAAGTGLGKYSNPSAALFSFDAGGGLRLFFDHHFSARLDVRDYSFVAGSSLRNELFVALAVALTVGGSEAQEQHGPAAGGAK